MSRFLLGVVSLLLLSSMAVNTGSSWRSWLPQFLQVGWSVEVDLMSETERARLANSKVGKSLLAFPTLDSLRTQMEWPLLGLDSESWDDAQKQAELSANHILPLDLNDGPLLLHQLEEPPEVFMQTARRFAPLHEQKVIDSATAAVLPILPASKVIVLMVDANHQWLPGLRPALSNRRVVLVEFGERLTKDQIPDHWTHLQLQARNRESECFAAQVLFGAQPVGMLPSSVSGYNLPDTTIWTEEGLERLDRRVNWAVRRRTTPGAQLLVMHRGNIILEKAYGHHDYRRRRSVSSDDLYDLASITKAAATSLAVMHLYDKGEILLQSRVKDYLPELANSIAGRYQIDQLLTHQTGLQSNLPAFDFIGRTFVTQAPDIDHEIQISPDRWLDNSIPEKIADNLNRLDYTRRPIYRYSDVNYYLLQLIVERISGQSLDAYVYTHIYERLGLHRLTFQPSKRIPAQNCVPSIYDPWMRETTLRGYVHDEGAALLGGVAGHAGLFSNARDLGRLFQMLLDGGRFGSEQIIQQSTVELFTSKYGYNYRALGFDRLMGGWPGMKDLGAGEATFGHTGFSGTSVWADPENELVFVLLTNRIFPDAKRNRFKKYKVRGRVQGDMYRAMLAK
ncbi:MAG: serine hydrolase domain-containing protein [Bacteroidota bacterium]